MINYKINPKYTLEFTDFLKNIKEHFNNNNNTIHKARNEIKVLEYAQQKVVVKAFKVPHLLNRIVYSFFRKSKARKSYEYSVKISEFVPKPIGYIEFYKGGLLHQSYFISEHFDYDFTIREPLLDKDFPQKRAILEAFAYFTFKLHQQDILHQDYSPGNILIKQDDKEFIFNIVDINRMQFKTLDLDARLKNFAKLWINDEDLTLVAKVYASLVKEDEELCITKALHYSHKHKKRINMKKRVKGVKVVD